ncbi:MAG: CcoQ/FixQ family Cbb3-type cytochrome c oxidase assembly chaperone [Cyclobacteriaceae bacterium]|nr:CcoQ/FixQ family Cbb3-type cytochrome c oxidase assembly chaperone [Cyclobacteriaceae bacterium HetDA_MAG_MS6]
MLKFIKHHMETIVGIEFFPLFSFIIFFLFFLTLIVWVIKVDKKKLKDISNLPLDNDTTP